MSDRPNILFLMCDQLQGRVFEPDHICQTPNIDRLAARGVRFSRAYTPNAVCSPARASLMTGLLPHNHGVLYVTHCVDKDQAMLRTDNQHWAQYLDAAGYKTGYFGKWHVNHAEDPSEFGWQQRGDMHSTAFRDRAANTHGSDFSKMQSFSDESGYQEVLFYGVTSTPPEQRNMGIATQLASDFLDEALQGDAPWCCFVSTTEPHDPFIAGEEARARYDADSIELPPNHADTMADKPGIYRRSARAYQQFSEYDQKEAAACYYASITEIDTLFGRLIDQVDAAGQMDNTIIILTADHGELLGAHGLYCKNFSAFEEVYNIPMIVAGPGIARDAVSTARVGLHDLHPTLLELTGHEPLERPDSHSFVPVLRDPNAVDSFQEGFAEYFGTRFILTQRVFWDGDWKFVFNGFDFDEMYNLVEDPYELHNLAEDPAHRSTAEKLMNKVWGRIERSGDHSVFRSRYPPLRIGVTGPTRAE